MLKILIANRGEIAVRVIDTCRSMNISSVAVYSDEDRHAVHVLHADEAVHIGPAAVEESYLNGERILDAARRSGADGVHPGYGFLSENADFARAVGAAGLVWIGPHPDAMETMASKIRAREIAQQQQIPVISAYTLAADGSAPNLDTITAMGLPLLVKASAGGGGIGMREIHDAADLTQAITQARLQAERQFGDGALIIERLLSNARHVEVQVLGDQHGNLLHLHDRDCSLQRRRQKLIEEAPAPGLNPAVRQQLRDAALRLAAAVKYHGVGTVEFLVQGDEFFLLEMNTRLQVEHGVTEEICGLDLVQLQIEVAMGQSLPFTQEHVSCDGHAIEARIYAEDPAMQFAPSVGDVSVFESYIGSLVRLDSGVAAGSRVSLHYDGLLCKLIAHGNDRKDATRALINALRQLCIAGVTTNIRLLVALLQSQDWREETLHIATVEQQLSQHLSDASIPDTEIYTLSMAATVWQFLSNPPAADVVPWPGGFQRQRNTRWGYAGQDLSLDWRWTAAAAFDFGPGGVDLQILAFDAEEPSLALEIEGIRRQFYFHALPNGVCVWESHLGSASFTLQSSANNQLSPKDASQCISAGPGQVLQVLVTPGQSVSRGDPLVVLESMKMESTLTAGCDGIVGRVAITAGDLVETDQLLVMLEQKLEVAP
ncbi:MAG: geranyl-CoA carboxylase alpha subunit [Candidatus Pseudothioglobus sp.]|jgi:geranyl-CoA carboxylase alpha subunit